MAHQMLAHARQLREHEALEQATQPEQRAAFAADGVQLAPR